MTAPRWMWVSRCGRCGHFASGHHGGGGGRPAGCPARARDRCAICGLNRRVTLKLPAPALRRGEDGAPCFDIQGLKSTEPQMVIDVSVIVHDDGEVHLERTDLTLALWNHDSVRLRSAMGYWPRAMWKLPVPRADGPGPFRLRVQHGHALAQDAVGVDTDSLGIDVRWSENSNDTDFSQNLVRARCEGRFGTSVYALLGVVVADLTA
jgi:hypothetical protein